MSINSFLRATSISADIDLTYLPLASRQQSLAAIEAALTKIGKAVEKQVPNAKPTYAKREGDKIVTRLIGQTYEAQIMAEMTLVLGGCVYAAQTARIESLFVRCKIKTNVNEATIVFEADLALHEDGRASSNVLPRYACLG